MIRIAIIGAGNAGCVTALHFYKYLSEETHLSFEITIYHSPNEHPIERVGQGTLLGVAALISSTLGIDWYNNPIDATFKTAFMYEGWGKKQDKIFAPFSDMSEMAMHFVPQKLSNVVLESKLFTVEEKIITDPEKEIDADWIFDCRGRNNRDKDNYESLINPLNSVLLCNKDGKESDLSHTRCVTTPNGWTFIIPNKDSVSYGYLYNNTITSKEDATEDFLERFDLPFVDGELEFENYMAKNIFVGERTILNGNKFGFIEPLESTALATYQYLCRQAWDRMFGNNTLEACNDKVRKMMKEVETFVLWHYQHGSKYDTPFWKYAKSLSFNPDKRFYEMFNDTTKSAYGQWRKLNFVNWRDGVE